MHADGRQPGSLPPPRSPDARAPLSREMLAAAEAVTDLLAGHRLPDALAARTASLPPASRAPARDMAYRTVRRLGSLQALVALLNTRRPLPRMAALQLVALAQLLEPMRPPAIVVDQAVAAARSLSRGPGGGAASFLNATLRRFVREREALLAAIADDPVARFDHPDWWLERLREAYPDAWESIARAGAVQAPLVLRVNRRRTDPDAYAERLRAAGLGARRVGPEAFALDEATPVERVPGFAQGEVSVQDAGAQLAAHLLDLAPGQRVLDACAAPGGKACHALELADVDLTAIDLDPERCRRIEDNLARCGLPAGAGSVRVLAADAARPAGWWDGRPYDRILLDAPCSASGIVRRHPDVRWLRRRGDIATLAIQQLRLLEALWPLLGPNGKFLYVTCSVFPDEGEAVVQRFVRDRADAVRTPLEWVWPDGRGEPVAQLLPQSGPTREHDGFFYASLTKRQ
ncbi:MAG TPA: 16S rRNA (cytosine(967)-C(5))-methyltransferase RsmB [Burkholderiaceae bacterium]|nr:16S rRNA (cytosine(967)-C(5))-methyltransferase RsmB [Burkholderiaceae bacterium]